MKVRYHYDDIGVNSRLDTIQAAILRVKLRYLVSVQYCQEKQLLIFMMKHFQDAIQLLLPERARYSLTYFHQYTIRVKNGKRDELKKFLESKNIPSMIYYPGPLHLQEAYQVSGI